MLLASKTRALLASFITHERGGDSSASEKASSMGELSRRRLERLISAAPGVRRYISIASRVSYLQHALGS